MKKDILKVLLTKEQIQKRVKELARQISRDYQGKDLTLVATLKGSVIFLSDLIRFMNHPCAIDFIAASSYRGQVTSSGVVRLVMDLRESPVGKNLLIVEDIIDTGYTMDYLLKNLSTRQPKSLKVCTLLDKPAARKVFIPIDYRGFTIPNEFVVGYGMDYLEKYRNLPYIGVLNPEIYRERK